MKTNAAEALRRELERRPRLEDVRIFMSSATDPYQPAESRYRITRSILDVFRELPVGLLLLQTRSPLVERDLDLLAGLPFAWLSMTVETDTTRCGRALTRLAEHRGRFGRCAGRGAGVAVQAAVTPGAAARPRAFRELIAGAGRPRVVDTFTGTARPDGARQARPLPALHRPRLRDWRARRARRCTRAPRRLARSVSGWSLEGFNAAGACATAQASVSLL